MNRIHTNENLSSESAVAVEPDSPWVAAARVRIFDEFKNIRIDALPFSPNLKNFFERMNIKTLGDLHALSLDDVASIPYYGKRTADEIAQIIKRSDYGDPHERVEVSRDKSEVLRNWQTLMDSGKVDSTLSERKQKISVPARYGNVLIKALPFSANLRNVLYGLAILRLADLERLSIREFAKTLQCGRKSVLELQSFIVALGRCDAAAQKIAGEFASDTVPATKAAKAVKIVKGAIASVPEQIHEVRELVAFINDFISELSVRDRKVVCGRFGGYPDDSIATLKEIGGELKIPRARVLQIQQKFVKTLRKRLGDAADKLFEKLRSRCLADVRPLTPKLLRDLAGGELGASEFSPAFYIRLLGELSPDLPVLPDYANYLRNATGDDDLKQTVAGIEKFLKGSPVPVALTTVFENIAEPETRTNRFIEQTFLRAICSKKFIIAETEDSLVITRASNAKRIRSDELVIKVLETSTISLTPEQIIERGIEMFGEERVSRSTDSVIGVAYRKSDVYRLDRRRIGLRKHFRLPPDMWDGMKRDVFDLLKGSGRSFSTKEIISEGKFAWTGLTTAEEAAQILREDPRFTHSAWFHIGLAENEVNGGESLTDSLLGILRDAGQPMSIGEIVRNLRNSRSVPETSVHGRIKKIEEIEYYGNGFCGLKVWDENVVREFLVKNDVFVLRTVRRARPPFNFDDLCRNINIKASGEQADELWKTLRRSLRLNLGSQVVRETVLIEFGKADTNAARKRKLRKSKDSNELFKKGEV